MWRMEPDHAREARLRLMSPNHAKERILRRIRYRDLCEEVQERSWQPHAIEGESDPHRLHCESRDRGPMGYSRHLASESQSPGKCSPPPVLGVRLFSKQHEGPIARVGIARSLELPLPENH